MRIIHQLPVAYIQPPSNGDIIINTISSSSAATTSLLSNSTSSAATIATAVTTINNYSSHYANLNGNAEHALIEHDDNVNLTISGIGKHSVKYSRNHNQNYRTETEGTLCNNLNQLNSFKCGNITDAARTNIGSINGNNENAARQIFEGNLNVLVAEEDNTQTRQRIIPSGPNVSEKNFGNCTEFKVESSITSEDEYDDDEQEKEDNEEEDDNLKLDNKIENCSTVKLIGHALYLNQENATIASGATNILNRNRNQVEGRNTSIALARKNLVKLDLDRNLQNLQQQHSNQQDDQICRQDGSFSFTCNSSDSSPDDSLMEDEDAYSETPSSCASLASPESTHYPRGIINPNYPGFQHLAHTLSEHFVNHHLDQDDSDLSEFEVELCVESLDENFASFQAKNNQNNNNNLNNNNVDIDRSKSPMDITKDTIEDICVPDQVNFNLGATEDKASRDHKELSLPEVRVSSSLGSNENEIEPSSLEQQYTPSIDSNSTAILDNKQQNTDIKNTITTCYQSDDDIACDLDTYLKQFETSVDAKTLQEQSSDIEEATRNCPTPDILIKNDKTSCRTKKTFSPENRPDLLRNVTPKSKRICDETICRSVQIPDNIQIDSKRSDKDEISYGITPVDIVGDFGREVEHEFGLIVSGYNTSLICQNSVGSEQLAGQCDEINFNFNKMTDAVLSDGKEEISVSSEVNIDSRSSLQTDCITCDVAKTSSITIQSNLLDVDSKQTITPLSPSEQSQNSAQQNDRSTVKLMNKNRIDCNSGVSSEKLIPTAIVKPKYQKSSYDDRQLPPIGLAYCDHTRPWYDQKSNNHQSTTANTNLVQSNDQRSRKIHQQFTAHLDRNAKYSKKLIGRASSIIARDKFLTNSPRYDKSSVENTGNSAVAIVTPRKKDKMENCESGGVVGEKRISGSSGRSAVIEKNNNNLKCFKESGNNNLKDHSASTASFDVYNIETALPDIDLEAIENHLRKAKEEERKRRNDREEIRRRLAMGAEDDYFSKIISVDRPGRKPSLQSRLQSGMNLQICFMNEASSDTESPSSDSETCPKLSKSTSNSSNMSRYSSSSSFTSGSAHPYNSRPLSINIANNNNNNNLSINKKIINQTNRPSTLSLGPPVTDEDIVESDFFTKQARLQIEARMALAQAKDMAHMQMEIERQKQKQSPITEVIRNSLDKVGVAFPPEKRRVSRQMLTDMNIAQLQIIVNELHTQIERLNEQLVQYLMERDDLHMGQDSMLVDIEDLTRYLGAKEQSKVNEKLSSTAPLIHSNESTIDFTNQQTTATHGGVQSQNKFLRIANLVKK